MNTKSPDCRRPDRPGRHHRLGRRHIGLDTTWFGIDAAGPTCAPKCIWPAAKAICWPESAASRRPAGISLQPREAVRSQVRAANARHGLMPPARW